MRIIDDTSYLNLAFIDRGLANAIPYQIRLDRFFTEEQKKKNSDQAALLGFTSKEWHDLCELVRHNVAEDNLKAIHAIENEYNIGQFRSDRKHSQLWFWCNDLSETVRDGRAGRDYSYCTLSIFDGSNPSHVYSPLEKTEIFETCKKVLADLPTKTNVAYFQYSTEYKPEKIAEAATSVYQKIDGEWIQFYGAIGKITVNPRVGTSKKYAFKKKYAKHIMYGVSDTELCAWGIDNGLL